jgi:uncharacterized protein (DUF2141 family)
MKATFLLLLATVLTWTRPQISASITETSTIDVEVTDVRSDKGQVEIFLFNQKEGYPMDPTKAFKRERIKIDKNKSTGSFADVPYGTYAIAGYHDENGDGALNFNFLHIPKEGVCASNDAKGHLGPPSFEDAKFSINHAVVKITMKMSY